MKKQLLIAAVAATMTSAAMADISITGDAKFEYKNVEISEGNSTNNTNTEVNLGIKGKNGDTTVVANLELNSHGGADDANRMDIEDLYMTTKIGDVTVKAGNYATGTSAILGEIDNGGRASNKVTLSTTLQGVKVYAGNSGTQGEGFTMIDGNMFAGVVADVAGFKVQAKKNSSTVNSFGIAGDVAGFGVRLEQKSSDTANNDVTFGHITKEVNGIKLGYAWVDADAVNLITEDDSAIFAVEAGDGSSTTTSAVDGLKQMSAQMSVAGNTVTVKSGTVEEGSTDNDFTQIDVKRALASGATLAVTYTDKDDFSASGSADTSTSETLEIDLSVKF